MSSPNPVPNIEERLLALLEAKGKAAESRFVTWLKANWTHFVTWAGVAYTIIKHL